MRYGHFDDDRREYVISRPDTPLPWINYLGIEDYFGIISNTAGGYSFFRDARLRRLSRYRYNSVPPDLGGRYLYVRDDRDGDYWSPSWQPTQAGLDGYQCRHGLSYTVIASEHRGIRAETLYYVPIGESLEVWRLRLSNLTATPRPLSVFSAIEFCLWDAQDDATNFQRNLSTGEVEVEDGVIYHKTEYRERRDHFAFFSCSAPPAGFDTQRDTFLGPYRSWDRPLAVERGESGDSVAHGWSPLGSHHVRLELRPREESEVIFLLGYAENPPGDKFDPPGSQVLNKRRVLPVIARWQDAETVATGLVRLGERWDEVLDALQVETPNPHADRMVNVWNAYQTMITFNLSRSASMFESGIGRGMGFRDSNQDLLGCVHLIPGRARSRILDLAATQLPSGAAYHQYQPLTKRGNDAIGSGFNDDPLWLVLSVAAYLKETGDTAILEALVAYDNTDTSRAPLLDHLRRSIRYTLERLGPHGLPLIGRADWNDCLNLNCFSEAPGESFQTAANREGGAAESVLIAGLFVLAAREMEAILRAVGRGQEANAYREHARAMGTAVGEHGWDGEWFLRAFDYDGNRVGSARCEEGQIFIEPQGICVMAGLGLDDGRALRALRSVRERLDTEHGIMILQPAYSSYHLELGEISSYPPGYKENGGVFCHTNPWIVIAEAMTGDGDAAVDHYLRINPSAREELGDVHRCEPYVYAQMIAGRDAATHGEAKNSWLTGTAAWNYTAFSQWILGIRPEHGGLRIDPVLPEAWEGFQASRRFRGAVYRITVRRLARRGARVRRLLVDGRVVDGNVIPVADAGSMVTVEADLEAEEEPVAAAGRPG